MSQRRTNPAAIGLAGRCVGQVLVPALNPSTKIILLGFLSWNQFLTHVYVPMDVRTLEMQV